MKTRTFQLNKLVRDKIIELTEAYGGNVSSMTISGNRLNQALIAKLIEEAKEMEGSKLSIGELADLQEIISQLAKNFKITDKELAETQAKKRAKNGGFTKGHFIKTLTVPADSEWADYYGSDSSRFPELK